MQYGSGAGVVPVGWEGCCGSKLDGIGSGSLQPHRRGCRRV